MSFEKLYPFRNLFLVASVLGFLLINVPFVYSVWTDIDIFYEALENTIAVVFMGEAFLLLFFFALLIFASGMKKPGWLFFCIMSILGGLAFSVPLQLYLWTRTTREENESSPQKTIQ